MMLGGGSIHERFKTSSEDDVRKDLYEKNFGKPEKVGQISPQDT